MVRIQVIKEEVDQSWSVLRIAQERTPYSWERVFAAALPELEDISEDIARDEQQYQIMPLKRDLFAAFHYTALEDVKVVIVGQDPYPQMIYCQGKEMPRAVGLSFSVRPEDEIPSSLMNIYRELQQSVLGFEIPNHGDLRDWARQGVLLLNSCLTLQSQDEDSHKTMWVGFLKKVMKAIHRVNPRCIYVLWGNKAQERIKPFLAPTNVVLTASHPSGYSASRGFFGCNHFNRINEILLAQNKNAIVWNLPMIEKNKIPPKKVIVEKKIADPLQFQYKPSVLPAILLAENTTPIKPISLTASSEELPSFSVTDEEPEEVNLNKVAADEAKVPAELVVCQVPVTSPVPIPAVTKPITVPVTSPITIPAVTKPITVIKPVTVVKAPAVVVKSPITVVKAPATVTTEIPIIPEVIFGAYQRKK